MSAFTSIKNGKLSANNNLLQEVKGSDKFKELLKIARECGENNSVNCEFDIDFLLKKTKPKILTLVISFLLGIVSSLPKSHFLWVYYELLLLINLRRFIDKEKVCKLFQVNNDILIRVIRNKEELKAHMLIVLVLDFKMDDVVDIVGSRARGIKIRERYAKYLDDLKSCYEK